MSVFTACFGTVFSLVLLSFSSVNAQPVTESLVIKNLFDQPEKVTWVRHYQGLMNEMHDVIVSIGSDGKEYKGYLLFQRSEERFLLQGKVNRDSIFLEEYGATGQLSGYILGQISPRRFLADWQNIDKNMSASLHLRLMEDKVVEPLYCGDDKWVKNFQGQVKDETIDILLQKQNNEIATGKLYLTGEAFELKGTICSGSYKLAVCNHKLEEVGKLEGSIHKGKIIGTLKYAENPLRSFILKEQNEMEVSCVEYADFSYAFNALYPTLKENEAFNSYIFKEVKTWLAQSRDQNLASMIKSETNQATDRLASRAYAWFDIAYISDKMISGYLIGNNTWTGSFRQAFNYDLSSKEAINFEDLFEMNPRFHEFISEQVAEALAHKPFFEEPEFQNWLFKQNFDMIAIKQNGIEFSSNSNMLYGAHTVTISYKALKPYFKIGNPLEYIYLANGTPIDTSAN